MFAERDEALLVSPFEHFQPSRRLNGGAWEPGPRLFIAGERLEETTSMRLGRNAEGRPVTKSARAGGWRVDDYDFTDAEQLKPPGQQAGCSWRPPQQGEDGSGKK